VTDFISQEVFKLSN